MIVCCAATTFPLTDVLCFLMNNETNAYTHTDFDTHWCCLLKAELGIGTKKVTSAAKNYSIIFVYVHPTPT